MGLYHLVLKRKRGKKKGKEKVDGRRNSDKSRVYEVQELQARQREILRLKLGGASNKEVAQQLDVTPQTVSNTINSSLAIEHMDGLQETRDQNFVEARNHLVEMLPKATAILEEGMDRRQNPEIMKRLKVAAEILDRVGVSKIQQIRSQTSNLVMTTADLLDIKQRALARVSSDETSEDDDVIDLVPAAVGGI